MNDIAWTFATANFDVRLLLEPEYGYQYDGDDEDGETQRKLDDGEYVAFTACVKVIYRGEEIGADYLAGCVYGAATVSEFWKAHRDSDPMNRNCTLYRAAHGENACVCHYFPDMVRQAVNAARAYLTNMPKMRKVA